MSLQQKQQKQRKIERSDSPKSIRSLEVTSRSGSASLVAAHERLRQAILEGLIAPGTVIAQARVAREYGLGRTPLREAVRMLEQEGLIERRPNRRLRITPISVSDLEEVYALRLTTECLSIFLSIPKLTPEDLSSLRADLKAMGELSEDYDAWKDPHARFHATLLSHAPARLRKLLAQLSSQAERYRHAYSTNKGQIGWAVSLEEHKRILEAASAGDAAVVAEQLARHYARVALSTIALVAPEHDPRIVRDALALVLLQTRSSDGAKQSDSKPTVISERKGAA